MEKVKGGRMLDENGLILPRSSLMKGTINGISQTDPARAGDL
jgi:hypothetical protein